jgi:CheY-like chemotaxis protein
LSKILVVDDEKIISLSLERVLKRSGHEVVVCNSGLEAVDILTKDSEFEFLFLDFLMPEISGAEVLDFSKKLNPKIQVIMMTAYGDQQTKADLLRRGATIVLSKPFDDILKIPETIRTLSKI